MSLCHPASGLTLRGAANASSSQCSSSTTRTSVHLRCRVIRSAGERIGFQNAKFSSTRGGGKRILGADGLRGGGDEAQRVGVRFRVLCSVGGGSSLSVEEWTKKLPAKRKALYSHSLPCIEAWLQTLGFVQCNDDRSVWTIERPDWHAQLSMDLTELYIRYLRKGPGNLDRDIERKFSYALSREDLENAILGGP